SITSVWCKIWKRIMMNCLKIKKWACVKFLALGVFAMLVSCGVNSNLMLKTAYGETASLDSLPIRPNEEYRIGVDDKVTFTLAVNGGVKLFDATKISDGGSIAAAGGTEFVVRRDSTIEVPVIGSFVIGGLTSREAEIALEKSFSKDFKDPFVQLKITNQRVIVFPGEAGKATIVPLQNTNTTLMEVLATAGGISERGKANTVKLIRKAGETRKMYIIDLSTIEGLKYTDLIVQANDYIYIEPKAKLASETLKEITPILSLFSTILVTISLISVIK
ncbi:MAG: polysaccharide biosynthesis/export family protein, partial [Bacteroidetes bacterium]|nr:polysaccharide biosynthesis/export family protein [Bacteroidota bacterium]